MRYQKLEKKNLEKSITDFISVALLIEGDSFCMLKNYITAEDILTDDFFLSWHIKADQRYVKHWDRWWAQNPGNRQQFELAVQILNSLLLREMKVPAEQISATEYIILQKIRRLEKKARTPVLSVQSRRLCITAASVILLATGLYGVYRWRAKPGI